MTPGQRVLIAAGAMAPLALLKRRMLEPADADACIDREWSRDGVAGRCERLFTNDVDRVQIQP